MRTTDNLVEEDGVQYIGISRISTDSYSLIAKFLTFFFVNFSRHAAFRGPSDLL